METKQPIMTPAEFEAWRSGMGHTSTADTGHALGLTSRMVNMYRTGQSNVSAPIARLCDALQRLKDGHAMMFELRPHICDHLVDEAAWFSSMADRHDGALGVAAERAMDALIAAVDEIRRLQGIIAKAPL